MSTVTCTAALPAPQADPYPLLRRWAQTALQAGHAAWLRWQEDRRLAADLQMLRTLDAATLRDVGLDYLAPLPPQTLTLRDRDIGRW